MTKIRNKEQGQQIENMVDINPTILVIITLNSNGLNISIKIQWWPQWIKIKTQICVLNKKPT